MFSRRHEKAQGAHTADKTPAAAPVEPAVEQDSVPPPSAATPARGADDMTDKLADGAGPSVIGRDLIITGNLVSKGEVRVEGTIQGDVHCNSLVVGDNAHVNGGITAQEVLVRGKVTGSIRATTISLASSSHMEGDVLHKALAIEQGAFFEGKSRRSEDPLSQAPQQPSAPAVGIASQKAQQAKAAAAAASAANGGRSEAAE